jgi:hypothetical protein
VASLARARFFARARWSPDELGLRLVDFIVAVFLAPSAPLLVAVDDTLLGRSGRWVADCFLHHDGAAQAGRRAARTGATTGSSSGWSPAMYQPGSSGPLPN